VIKNVSAPRDTARAGDGLSVPGEFDSEVPHKGRTYRVRLVWRGGGTIGVAPNAEPVERMATFAGWSGRMPTFGRSCAT